MTAPWIEQYRAERNARQHRFTSAEARAASLKGHKIKAMKRMKPVPVRSEDPYIDGYNAAAQGFDLDDNNARNKLDVGDDSREKWDLGWNDWHKEQAEQEQRWN